MPTKKNIIVGAARIFITGSGNTLDPVNNSAGVTAVKATGTTPQGTFILGVSGWRDVGYTQDGLTVATNPTYTDIPVDQLLDAAKIFKESMTMSFNTTFAEATLDNLIVAWGQDDSTLTSAANERDVTLFGGSLGSPPIERSLIAVGNGPEKSGSNAYQERTYGAYRVISVDGVSTQLARADATTIPVSFRALPADDGTYGFVRDRSNV